MLEAMIAGILCVIFAKALDWFINWYQRKTAS